TRADPARWEGLRAAALASVAASTLVVQPDAEYRHRSAIAVVGGVADELHVPGQVQAPAEPHAVIGLRDVLETGMRQPAVADTDAETARAKVFLIQLADLAGLDRRPPNVVGPMPARPLQRHA